jgi:hypothetical protein
MGALHTTLLMRMALLAIIPIDQQVYAKQLDEIYQKKKMLCNLHDGLVL